MDWFLLIVGGGSILFGIVAMITKASAEANQNSGRHVPHKCKHCDNNFYIKQEEKDRIKQGGTVECSFCHKWTH